MIFLKNEDTILNGQQHNTTIINITKLSEKMMDMDSIYHL